MDNIHNRSNPKGKRLSAAARAKARAAQQDSPVDLERLEQSENGDPLPADRNARLPGAHADESPLPERPPLIVGSAGWLPDPNHSEGLRYYDGAQWTKWTWRWPPPEENSNWNYTATMLELAGADLQFGSLEKDTSNHNRHKNTTSDSVTTFAKPKRKSLHGFAVVPFVFGIPVLVYMPAAFVVAVIAAVILIKLWPQYNLVSDIATVEADGAHIGICEFQGFAEPVEAPVFGWLTGRPQIASTVMAEREFPQNRGTIMEPVWHYPSGHSKFWLRTANGSRIMIDATDHLVLEEWQEAQTVLDAEVEHRGETGVYLRVTERGLVVGAPLYVLGPVQMKDDGTLVVTPKTVNALIPPPSDTFIISMGEQRDVLRAGRNSMVLLTSQILAFTLLGSLGIATENGDLHGQWVPIFAAVTAVSVMLFGGGWLWRTWNRLTAIRWRVQAAWSLISVGVERRHNLINALVDITSGAMSHELSTRKSVAELRTPTRDEINQINDILSYDTATADRIVFAAHLQLSTEENVRYLIAQLTRTEDQIASARKFYNDAVVIAKIRRQTFPISLLARFAIGHPPPFLSDISDQNTVDPQTTNLH